MAGDAKGKSLLERFNSKVNKNGPVPPGKEHLGPCEIWIGWCDWYGYGRISYQGKSRKAQHIAWILANGPIPEGRQVLHLCNVPSCVRVDHLELGDHARNMEYKGLCGRTNPVRGEDHYDHKVTEEIVREIRRRHVPLRMGRPPKGYPKGTTYKELAKEFGLAINAVKCIVLRKTWKHVS